MKTNYTAAAALAGGLLIFALMQGTASSASLPILNSPHSGVTLVGHGGGGGGGGGGNGGGGEEEEVMAAAVAPRWLTPEA